MTKLTPLFHCFCGLREIKSVLLSYLITFHIKVIGCTYQKHKNIKRFIKCFRNVTTIEYMYLKCNIHMFKI